MLKAIIIIPSLSTAILDHLSLGIIIELLYSRKSQSSHTGAQMSIGVVKHQMEPLSIRCSVALPNIKSLNANLVCQMSDATVLFNMLKLAKGRFLRQTSDCSPNVRCKRQNLSPTIRCLLQMSETWNEIFLPKWSSLVKLCPGWSCILDSIKVRRNLQGNNLVDELFRLHTPGASRDDYWQFCYT